MADVASASVAFKAPLKQLKKTVSGFAHIE